MKNETIEKPMSVARNELIIGITELINQCQLPLFVIEDVLKDIYGDIRILSQKQLENDLRDYRASLEAASKGDS